MLPEWPLIPISHQLSKLTRRRVQAVASAWEQPAAIVRRTLQTPAALAAAYADVVARDAWRAAYRAMQTTPVVEPAGQSLEARLTRACLRILRAEQDAKEQAEQAARWDALYAAQHGRVTNGG